MEGRGKDVVSLEHIVVASVVSKGKENGTVASSVNGRVIQSKSDFGKELFPTNSTSEIRRRTKLLPFRAGRYMPSDAYLYSSCNFGITDKICSGMEKDIESKGGTNRTKNNRVETEVDAKETRIQSASFHGHESKRTHPKLRTRCRSTDCNRVTGQDKVCMRDEVNHFDFRKLRDRVKCRSADLSKQSLQVESYQHSTCKMSKKKNNDKPNTVDSNGTRVIATGKAESNKLCGHSDLTLTEIIEADMSTCEFTKSDVLFCKKLPNEKNPFQTNVLAIDNGVALSLQDEIDSIGSKSTFGMKEKNCLLINVSLNGTTDEVKLKKHKVCSSKLNSRRNIKDDKKSISKLDSLPRNKCVLEDSKKVDKLRDESSLNIRPLRSSRKGEILIVTSNGKEQKNSGRDSVSKFTPPLKRSPAKNGGKKVDTSASHSSSGKEKNSIDQNRYSKSISISVDNRDVINTCMVSEVAKKDCSNLTNAVRVFKMLDSKAKEEENLVKNVVAVVDGKNCAPGPLLEVENIKDNLSKNISNPLYTKTVVSYGQTSTTADINNIGTNFCNSKDSGKGKSKGSITLQRNKLLKRSSSEKNVPENDRLNINKIVSQKDEQAVNPSKADQGYSLEKCDSEKNNLNQTKVISEKNRRTFSASEKEQCSCLKKRVYERDQSNLNMNPDAKQDSCRRLSGSSIKNAHDRKTVDSKMNTSSPEASRKLAFERRESYSKKLREKNMRNAENKKKTEILNKRKGLRLQDDSPISVKIKHAKSRRLLRRNVAYVKREQKVHFSEEHDHDSWVLFTVTLSSSLVTQVIPEGSDQPDGTSSVEHNKLENKVLLSCVLLKSNGNAIPTVKTVMVGSLKCKLKRLSFLPVKKLRWSLYDGMVMYLFSYHFWAAQI